MKKQKIQKCDKYGTKKKKRETTRNIAEVFIRARKREPKVAEILATKRRGPATLGRTTYSFHGFSIKLKTRHGPMEAAPCADWLVAGFMIPNKIIFTAAIKKN